MPPPPALAPLARGGWDDLLDRVGNGDPLRRLDVLAVPAAATARPHAVTVGPPDRITAGAALALGRARGMTVARTLGRDVDWFDVAPPAEPGAEDALAAALLAVPAHVLTLPEVPPDAPVVTALRRRGSSRLRVEHPTYRVRPVDDDARRLVPRLREAGRVLRRLARAGHHVEVGTLDAWPEVRDELPEAVALHRRRWGRPVSFGFGGSPEHGAEVDAMLAVLGEDQRLRLTRVRVDGRLRAFALSAVAGGRAAMYRTAYDRDVAGASGLGAAAVVRALADLGAGGADMVDLGAGNDAFKRQLTTPQAVVTLQVALAPRGRLLLAAAAGRSALSRRAAPGPPGGRGPAPRERGV